MAEKKISIKQLRPGMYIVGLDISWIKSPFLTHSIRVKDQNDVVKVKKAGVKEITIDTVKGDDVESNDKPPAAEEKTVEEPVEQAKSEKPIEKTSLAKELRVAKEIKSKSIEVAGDAGDKVRQNKPLNASPITPIIHATLESIARNDQAVLSLLHLESSNEKLLTHLFNTFSLSLALAVRLDLPEDEKEALGLAAFIHDAAWSKLPYNLFGTGKKYTGAEGRLVQQHIDIICSLLSSSDGFSPHVVKIIREHHECGNGKGYPQGLSGDDICFPAKILAVADLYDEIIHGLAGHPGMLPNNALSYLYRIAQAGEVEVDIVAQLVNIIGVYPLNSAVMLSSEEKGIVIENNREQPIKPIVEIYYKASGKRYAKPITKDLSNEKDNDSMISITSILDPHAEGVDPFGVLKG